MEAQHRVKHKYRPRYCNTKREVADIKPGENIVKYIRDCFETAREHPVLIPSLSSSSCSSPDLNQGHSPPPAQKKNSPSSGLIDSIRRAFSAASSKARPKEAGSPGGNVFLPDSSDEDEMSLGSPALLVEEPEPPRDPQVAPPDQHGSLFLSSASQAPPPHLPWNTAGPESENEGEFLIAESFGDPGPAWLLQSPKSNLLKERRLRSPLLESDLVAKEHRIGNVHGGAHVPVVEPGNSFSKQPQSVAPAALQSPTSKRIQKQKSPKNVPPKKQAERSRKNMKSSARGAGRKCGVLSLEKSSESESEELGVKRAKMPPGDRLTPLGKRSAHVSHTFLVSPDDGYGRALTQEGPCEAGKAFLSMEQQNSKTLSAQFSSVRAINMNDLSGPVCKQDDKLSFEREIRTRANIGDPFLGPPRGHHSKKRMCGEWIGAPHSEEPSVSLEEDSVLLTSDSLKNKVVRSPDNATCLRRSKRLRLKPLEYWRGERVMYKMKPSGGLVASGIISPKQQEPSKLKRMKQPTKMDLEKMLKNANAALKDPSQPAHVFDAASKQAVLLDCVSSGHSPLLFFKNEDVFVYKYFSTPLFSAGKLIVKPLKEKGSQHSDTDTLVFHILKGRLLFTLYDQCYSLCAGNYFYVPAGNIYNIQNVLNEECILFFIQIKGNRLEGE